MPQTEATTGKAAAAPRRLSWACRMALDQISDRVRGSHLAQDEVEQQDRDFRVARLLQDALAPLARIDHRVRLALREVVIPQVDDAVLQACFRVFQTVASVERGIGVDRNAGILQHLLGLEAKGAPGEEAAQVALLGQPALDFLPRPGDAAVRPAEGVSRSRCPLERRIGGLLNRLVDGR